MWTFLEIHLGTLSGGRSLTSIHELLLHLQPNETVLIQSFHFIINYECG